MITCFNSQFSNNLLHLPPFGISLVGSNAMGERGAGLLLGLLLEVLLRPEGVLLRLVGVLPRPRDRLPLERPLVVICLVREVAYKACSPRRGLGGYWVGV